MSDIEDCLPSWQASRRAPLRWLVVVVLGVGVISAAGAGGVLAGNRADQVLPAATPSVAEPSRPAVTKAKPQAAPLRSPATPDKQSSSPNPAPAPSSSSTTAYLPVVRAKYGDHYWAVFLAVTPTLDDVRQTSAELQALAAGYSGRDQVLSSMSCQMGARESLVRSGVPLVPGLDYAVLLLMFSTEQQAAAFVDSYAPPVVGTAPVTWTCAG